ncbi:MAG: hypothetical protein ACI9L9_002230 [Marivirga sp.]|jgi:hypothetical protein
MGNKFKLSDTDESLLIDDSYKTIIGWMTALLIMNVITSLIILYVSHFNLNDELNIIWVASGSISLITVTWFWMNRVVDNRIPLNRISQLKTRNILGGQRFTIVLKNGKRRDINLDKRNYFNELESLKELFKQKNIRVE